METKLFNIIGCAALILTVVSAFCFYLANYFQRTTDDERYETFWGMSGVATFFISLICTAGAFLLWQQNKANK